MLLLLFFCLLVDIFVCVSGFVNVLVLFLPQLVNKLHLFHCEDDGVDKSVFFLFCFFVYYLQLLCWDLYLVFC